MMDGWMMSALEKGRKMEKFKFFFKKRKATNIVNNNKKKL